MIGKLHLPPVYLVLTIMAMMMAHIMLPLAQVVEAPYRYLGLLPIFAGLAIVVWAGRCLMQHETTFRPFEESRCIVAEGPFRLSRNPIYLGMVVALAGLAVFLGSATPVIFVPVFAWIITKRFIEVEEGALTEKFGDDYARYRNHVRRWL